LAKRFLSIGECMVELSQAEGGLLRKGYAGDTFNTAWYARICLPTDWTVSYYTALGDDPVSDEMLAFMAKANVETGDIRRIKGRTPGLYMIHLKDGERSFSYWRDTSAAKDLAADPDHLRRAIDAADIVYVSGITLAILKPDGLDTLLSELRRAKVSGKPVAFDPNLRPRLWPDRQTMLDTISLGARAASIVLPGFDDEAAHFGDASVDATLDRYKGLGATGIVVKDGAKGATLDFGDGRRHVPAATVDKVVDTTSAGDSYNGAFLARYLDGASPEDAAAFAARVAASVISHHGALIPAEKLGL
jgi:2-dehydro-3-deoxygluconokinase